MAWALLIIAAALTVATLVIVLGLRWSIMVILAVVSVSIAGLIWYAEIGIEEKSDVIPVAAVQFVNTQMTPAYGGSYELKARVKNVSPDRTLTRFALTVIASDCAGAAGSEQCVVIGEQSKQIHIMIPPLQARDITDQFVFDNMRPKGDLSWDYRVDNTRGK
jgi:hypothetical protein